MDSKNLVEFSPVKGGRHETDGGIKASDTSRTKENELEQSSVEAATDAETPDQVGKAIGDLNINDNEAPDIDSDDEDDDEYRLMVNPERPRRVTEKKRLDIATFTSWLAKNERELTKQSTAAGNALALRAQDSRVRTLSSLQEEHENKKIIESPREYQIELFERAKQKNTIIVLDTGSGKTLISALLLRNTLEKELQDRALKKQKKVAFFLVEKVALCVQQYGVLKDNLDHDVAIFYGDTTGLMKTKEFWDVQFDENMLIVCTAQILLDCLNSGFIKMSTINLLIFDEAHHTKKNHPYARIIKNHYVREKKEERPRILGMTASPVDAQTSDIRAAAFELESILCSEIATVPARVVFQSQKRKDVLEMKETYFPSDYPINSRTQLWFDIQALVKYNTQFRTVLEFTAYAGHEFGPWMTDWFWKCFMTEDEVNRLTARTNNEFAHDFGTVQGEQATEAVRKVQKLVQERKMEPINRSSRLLTNKVRALFAVLRDCFEDFGMSRAIVFVEKRYTAFLLADLFTQPGMEILNMKAGYMVGTQQLNPSTVANMSASEQKRVMKRFRDGEINCLFATPVAEEGIDVPECDLVVRFDLFNSVIQYVQSKGRARQNESRYYTLVEEGNMKHLMLLHGCHRDAQFLRNFCEALPEDRKIHDYNIDLVAAAQDELIGQKTYEIASTGARLTFPHSLEILAKFVSSLSTLTESAKAEFMVTGFGKKFIAEVVLPDCSPIKAMSGFPQRSKILARCSAAFETCVELIKKKYINEHFQPVFAKKLPAMRNARLAVSANKKAEYVMRIRPEIWSGLGNEKPAELFVTAIVLENPEAVGRPCRPLLLLSRKRIPEVPDIPLFFGNSQSSLAKLISSNSPLKMTEDEVDGLTIFTLKVFDDVFSKEYEANPEELPYFLAPCVQEHNAVASGTLAHIDWPTITIVRENESLAWEDGPESFFHDKFVTDRNDGSRKLTINGIEKSLRPSDPTPEGVPKHKSHAYRSVEQTIKEYSNSLWLKARKRATWRDDQPVVKAELLSLRRNLLDEFQVDEDINNECFVILEPLRVSPLPMDFVSMAMAFPAIIHRIDSALITLEACNLVNLSIKPALALEALTKDSDNTGDHDKEQLNFQAGMGNNYERLEFLGDSFLKMATTISLFTLIPDSNEFEYHVERMLLVCNRNLFNHAVDRKLQEYVRSKSFDRRAWYPNLRLKKGKAPKTELRHNLADKSIADVCEALIGAAYLTTEDGNFDMAVRAVTEMVRSKNHNMLTFKDYYSALKVPEWHSGPSSAAQRLVVDRVASCTGYRFNSALLLRSAFKHPSWPYESIPNYQRLEFLGDALLDMAIVDYLFKRFPAADPQWLTEHKMAMASNQFLGCVCVTLKLHKHLLVTTSALPGQIHRYVEELEEAEREAREEAEKTGNPMQSNFWMKVSHPSKALPDIVEALIGAMFVDSSYDYSVVQSFFTRFIEPYFEDMELYDNFASQHPVTFLDAKMQQDLFCNQWRILTSNVPCPLEDGVQAVTQSDVVCALMVHGKVFLHATAKSGRYAKIAVAKKALQKFKEMGLEEVKREMGCDCKASAETVLAGKKGLGECGTAI
ncbi:Fc.00g079770.m01.CDS01 [Cosmosporella sp. VM-42]